MSRLRLENEGLRRKVSIVMPSDRSTGADHDQCGRGAFRTETVNWAGQESARRYARRSTELISRLEPGHRFSADRDQRVHKVSESVEPRTRDSVSRRRCALGSETQAKRPTRNRPGLELLEQRVVLSTYNAVNVAELQADIALLNNKSGPNTIVLAPGTYSLTKCAEDPERGQPHHQGRCYQGGGQPRG